MPTILCIDDRRVALDIRRTLLGTVGYSVFIADNGKTGLDMLAANEVDAVLLDYKMEGMDGLAVARVIKQRNPRMPIVLVSGYPL